MTNLLRCGKKKKKFYGVVNTCQMGDEYCILRFMEMALGDVRCFMEPVKKKSKRKRQENDDDNKEEEEEKKTNFLFFHFECMQETGVHVPNLVVIQDDEGHEWVFKGTNTCKDFCDWLLGGSMDGSVCIAHISKGCDSYFILKYLYDNKVRPGLIMKGSKIMEMTVAESDIRFVDCLNFLPHASFPKRLD